MSTEIIGSDKIMTKSVSLVRLKAASNNGHNNVLYSALGCCFLFQFYFSFSEDVRAALSHTARYY
jgi:hypothetical protein